MSYKIVKINQLSGNATTVYSIIEGDESKTLFDKFIASNIKDSKEEIAEILKTLSAIGKKQGARESYFRKWEGKKGDLVCALYDRPGNKLRLYCIRFGSVAIILGGGGPKKVKAWQNDETLKIEAEKMIAISEAIYQRLKENDLTWSKDGKELIGDLNFNDNEH